MRDAVKKAGVINMLAFNYRRTPAVQLAKKLIDEGAIGAILATSVGHIYRIGRRIRIPRFPGGSRKRFADRARLEILGRM